MERFPDGARVCFVGDSITAVYDFEGQIAQYYRDNFRDSNVRIYNCGVSGGRAWTQLNFLEKDTLIHSPTHAVVMLGVNDSARWLLGAEKTIERYEGLERAYETYKVKLPELCDALEKAGAEIILCTPAPYAEYMDSEDPALRGGFALVAAYAEFCRQLAEKRGYPLCDFHNHFAKKIQTEKLYNDDRIHPNSAGHYEMAKLFLAMQGLDLGEQKPLPDDFKELVKEAMILRDVLSAEINVIANYNYTLPVEEKYKYVREYLASGRAPGEYYKRIAQVFLDYNSRWDEQMEKVRNLTDKLMG